MSDLQIKSLANSGGHGSKFEKKKEQAIVALLTQPNVERAAEAIQISYATLRRWMKDQTFRQDYMAARRESMVQAVGFLQQAASTAVEALVTVAQDKEAPHSARVQAARCILEIGFKAMEQEDIGERLAILEQKADKRAA